MSQSSNYNCISADCARVIYREYLPPVVRWRYPGEEWREIEADDYAIEQKDGQCEDGMYRVEGTYLCKAERACNQRTRWKLTGNGITSGRLSHFERDIYGNLVLISYFTNSNGTFEIAQVCINGDAGLSVVPTLTECTGRSVRFASSDLSTVKIDLIEKTNGDDDCSLCTLTITKDGVEVHRETRDICPEVEQLPCRLADISKEIKIDKTPYLSAIEVTQLDNDAIKLKKVPFPLQGVGKAPDECWNIYRNEIFDPFPSGDADDPNEPAFGDFITQICSAFSCPPPEYEVICNCNIQCPAGTCGVFCGEYLCCYNSTGKSVKAIHYTDIPDFGIPDNTVGLNDLGGNFA